MKQINYSKILAVSIFFTLILSACIATATDEVDPAISTSVAQTIQAHNAAEQPTLTATPVPPTATLGNLVFQSTLLPTFTPAPSTSSTSGQAGCLRAELTSETIPDGTIVKPGEVFTKTWTLKNTGTCAWDTSFKIVYMGGDIMGGGFVYNLPLYTAPGGAQDIDLVLTAPSIPNEYSNEWYLQAADGTLFGVGQYNAPFTTAIVVVNPLTQTADYRITNVEYEVIRDPVGGCATNVLYTINAKVTTNGPLDMKWGFNQSDGNSSNKGFLTFTKAETLIASNQWQFHLGSTPGDKWMQFVILKPYVQEFHTVNFSYLCGN